MPTIKQGPSLIPTPKLTASEVQERQEDLSKTVTAYQQIVEKIEAVLPTLIEIQKMAERLQKQSDKSRSNRAIHLSRRLKISDLHHSIGRAIREVKMASRHKQVIANSISEADLLILDANLLR